jgi:hypothetical protein
MKSNNLVPTPIVNKNGVRTTVHKKTNPASTATAILPAPGITTDSAVLSPKGRIEIIKTINSTVKEYQSLNGWNPKKWSYGDLGTTLHSCSDTAIIAIRDLLLTDPKGFLQREERDDFLFALAQKDEKVSGTTVHEYVTYREHLKSCTMPTKIKLIKGLHSYTQLPAMENYSDAAPETKTSIIALLSVAKNLYRSDLIKDLLSPATNSTVSKAPVSSNDGPLRLTDNNLVALLIERPEAADEITIIITEKGISDGELIRDMIESDTPSIRDGLL